MVVDVVAEALEHVVFGEAVVLDLVHDLVVDLEVVVVLVVEVVSLLLGLGAVLADEVLVEDVVGGDELLLESLLVFEPLPLLLRVQVALALVVRVLVVHSVVEVLVVELLILTVQLTHACIEPDGHIFINK